MLMSHASMGANNMALLMMRILLAMVLLVRLMLILLRHAHLHVPLVRWSPVHHDVLPLLVALIEYTIRVVIRCLRNWRS